MHFQNNLLYLSNQSSRAALRAAEAKAEATGKVNPQARKANQRQPVGSPPSNCARRGKTTRQKTRKDRLAIEWLTSAEATSRLAASAPSRCDQQLLGRTAVDLGLAGNVVVVFGAARGIGAAIAGAFRAEGAHVAAVDRDPCVHDLARALPQSLGLVADVTDINAVRSVAQEVENRLGASDHVIFAVGAGSGKFGFPFWKLEPADWEPVLRVNLISAVNVAHVFAPAMAGAARSHKREVTGSSPSILFLSSVAGQIGSQTDPPYSAAKAALINFSQCAAKDLASHGVRVNTLCPGMVQTPLNRGVYEAWAREQTESERSTYEIWTTEKIRNLVPLNRWQQPEEIAAMAVFLASNQARNITGQTINVDGGYVMHW
jgi:2-hydroxycyclohexanecarboxyl-CoA dehydrogenase